MITPNEEIIQQLRDELEKTKQELEITKEHLKKYTAPTRHKTYYENHKQEILEKMKQKPPVDKEKRKEINRKAYLKKKEKLQKIENNI
jgi:hypothetical protein